MSIASPARTDTWRYSVCGLLLLATMLNYMDRQTLAQLITTIQAEFRLNDAQYGEMEMGFGLAFAAGALCFGLLADKVSVRWLYPAVLIGWSLCGIATAYADQIGALWPGTASGQAYRGFLVCRVALGFFEAGHWPCALITTQTILSRSNRSFGNSILQSGAALGAILTPIIIITMLPPERMPPETVAVTVGMADNPAGDGSIATASLLATGRTFGLPAGVWRPPFVVIGLIGLLWVLPWLILVRGGDLVRTRAEESAVARDQPAAPTWPAVVSMCIALVLVVVSINLTWQFFRAWLPKFLEADHGYTKRQVGYFTSAYYIATDAGCITVGIAVKWLAGRGWDVHRARLLTFALCTGLVLLAVAVAFLPTGPLLLCLLLLIGAGALGLFPNYYAFTQELTRLHQGKVTGTLGTITWVSSALMQKFVGENINETHSYTAAITMAGLCPLVALTALLLLWPRRPSDAEPPAVPAEKSA